MNKYLFAIAVALVLVGAGCRKNVDDTTTRGPIDIELVETSILGYVLNETGEPLPFAYVNIGNETVQSNERGAFLFRNKLLDKYGTLIKVKQTGFHDAFKFVYPHLGTVSQVEIRMRAQSASNTFSADAEHTLNFASGNIEVQVTIPANAVADQNGQVWTGSVTARTVAYDPTDAEDRRVVPGDFRAQNSEGDACILKSFGMFGVELTSASGAPLNLLPGQKAKISLKIPGNLSGQAPSEIPLWHFNEINGYWEEEGSATLVNGRYEGEVAHFSFWNCDIPSNFAFINGRVVTTTGEVAAYAYVQVSSTNWGTTWSHCDDQGNFSGLVPNDETLDLQIGLECTNNVVEIGPFDPGSQNNIGTKSLSEAAIRYKGKLVSCSGVPLANGVVYIKKDTSEYLPILALTDGNGEFDIYSNNCNIPASAEAQAYDLANDLVSTPVPGDITNNLIDFGNIVVCDPQEEYIMLELGSPNPTIYTYNINPSLVHWGDSLLIKGLYLDNGSVTRTFDGNITYSGNGAASGVMYHYLALLNTGWASCFNCINNDVATITAAPTNVGDFGAGFVLGTARRVSTGGTQTTTPYKITFKIRRDQ